MDILNKNVTRHNVVLKIAQAVIDNDFCVIKLTEIYLTGRLINGTGKTRMF